MSEADYAGRISASIAARCKLFDELQEVTFARSVERIAYRIVKAFRRGGTVYLCGNGGSASDCDHIAAEFVGRFRSSRLALPALALTTSIAAITAVANDFSYDEVFERQVQALARPQDLIFGLSTSGRSKNVLRAMAAARTVGADTVAVTGQSGGDLLDAARSAIVIPSTKTALIQEATLMTGHLLCETVEAIIGASLDRRPD